MRRVVVTGLGVCAPNGVGLEAFQNSLLDNLSGIRFEKELEELNFSCQIAGKPNIDTIELTNYFSNVQLKGLNSSGLIYGVIAGLDAWNDAQLVVQEPEPDWHSGIVFGTGILGVDKF